MASINTVRAILSAIRGASQSQSVGELSTTTRETETTVGVVVNDLTRNGYIKEHSQRAGMYFTRTPKRGQIAAFLDGQDSLEGMSFTEPATQPAATSIPPTATVQGSLIKSILMQIKNSEHALPLGQIGVLGYSNREVAEGVGRLEAGKVIKLDEAQEGYFTRKPMRTKINRFLADLVTVDQLLDPTLKNMPELATAPTISAPATAVACPAIVAPDPAPENSPEAEDEPVGREFAPQPRAGSISGLDDLISELVMVRDNAASMAVRACDEFLSGLR
jgi:hypothetical protein